MTSKLRKATAVALFIAALGALRTAGALEAGAVVPSIFLGSDDTRSCGASLIEVDYEVDYDSDLQGYGVSAARLSGLDERCQGFDVVVSLNGPGGVLLAEMTSAVDATRMRVAVPVGTPVAAEQLTGVSVVLRGNGA